MKFKILINCVLFLFFSAMVNAQTAKIAFESHGGDMNDFFTTLDMDNDFGLPAKTIQKIIKTSDTTVVEIAELMGKTVTDTVLNHPYCNNPDVSLDSLKKMYPSKTKFVGFENAKKKKKEEKAKKRAEKKKQKQLKKEKVGQNTPVEAAMESLAKEEPLNEKNNNKTWLLLSFLPVVIGGLTWFNLKTTES